jgi:hypothetical protein
MMLHRTSPWTRPPPLAGYQLGNSTDLSFFFGLHFTLFFGFLCSWIYQYTYRRDHLYIGLIQDIGILYPGRVIGFSK